jgi:2-dehydropantoate 2-reductase
VDEWRLRTAVAPADGWRHSERMKIGIIGVGAIGGWVAGRLALAGHQVSVLARGATATALAGGIILSENGQEQSASLDIATDASVIGLQDVLVIAVKAPALADAAEAAWPMIGSDTLIVPMMNGVPWWFVDGAPLASVDPGGRIAAALPLHQVMGCVVHAACRRSGPARIEVAMVDRLLVGETRGATANARIVLRPCWRVPASPAKRPPISAARLGTSYGEI